MHPGAAISGLVLLLAAAVESYTEVLGVAGHPITLPCNYTASKEQLITCWGQGQCSSSCSDTLIWTDGYGIYYRKSSRYQLKGQISQGNVSLTIEHALESDSGLYCCRVQTTGWLGLQVLTFLLKVRPEIPTSPPTIPITTTEPTATTRLTAVRELTTTSTRPTQAPVSTSVSTAPSEIPVHTKTPKPAAVDSYTEVLGVVGHPVTLPCNYTASKEQLITRWGQGRCNSSSSDTLIWTDGYGIYYRKSSRYQLKGQISQGNVSLTIEHALESDSGLYCCQVQTTGWLGLQVLTFLLKVRPETPTSPPTIPITTTEPTATTRLTAVRELMTTSTRPTQAPVSRSVSTAPSEIPVHTKTPKPETPTSPPTIPVTTTEPTATTRLTAIREPTTTSTRPTQVPVSTSVSTAPSEIPVHTQTPKPVAWNGTATQSSEEPSNNRTEAIPTHELRLTTTKGLIVGISIAVLVLLILSIIHMRKKTRSLRKSPHQLMK